MSISIESATPSRSKPTPYMKPSVLRSRASARASMCRSTRQPPASSRSSHATLPYPIDSPAANLTIGWAARVGNLARSRSVRACVTCSAPSKYDEVVATKRAPVSYSSGIPQVICPWCGYANKFPEFDQILIFLCDECSEPVEVDEASH
jgi:hypothetical protein